MKLVIDASVAIKWFVNHASVEENTEQAIELFKLIKSGDIQVIQPLHWLAEIIAVLSRVRADVIDDCIILLDALEFKCEAGIEVYQQAAQLSISYNHHLFDTLYHAVAIKQKAIFITADKKYYNKVSKEHANVTLLSNLDDLVTDNF